ncbi:MAG: biotin/lipoyl-binding protein, partial [Coleofasciculus sp. S288]|nr:biotin/lipoyl-binding protein [Coleofasciculus sp. S288]
MELPLIGKIKRPIPWLMGLIAASILAVGGTAYWMIVARTPKNDLEELTVPVQVQNLTVRITANGTVKPIQSVNLSPKTAGRIAKLLVEQGESVKEGQVVAVMENAELQAQLFRVRAEFKQAQARLAEAKAGSRAEEIAQAKARLAQARARLNEARQGNPTQIDQA